MAEYLFEKVTETELMNESLATIVQGAEVSSRASSDKFISFGDGIIDDDFFMGNLITEHIEHITVTNLSSYILSIPNKGNYSIKDFKNEEKGMSRKSGALTLATDRICYDGISDVVDDYCLIINKKNLNSILKQKYNVVDLKSDMIPLNLSSEQVHACFQFIESTLNMLRVFPDARNTELVKKNLREIASFMLVDIVAEGVNAKSVINTSPEKYLVIKAKDIMEAECEDLFTIQEIADQVYTSPRNLQRAFKKHSTSTPIQFLHTRKLHRARKILLANHNPFCTVKEVALKVGIFNLGRFSQHYFTLFGEYPSHTLKH